MKTYIPIIHLFICCSNCENYNDEENECKDCDDSRKPHEYCTAFSIKKKIVTEAIFRFIEENEENKE